MNFIALYFYIMPRAVLKLKYYSDCPVNNATYHHKLPSGLAVRLAKTLPFSRLKVSFTYREYYNLDMSTMLRYFRKNWIPLTVIISLVLLVSIMIQVIKEESCPTYIPWYQCAAKQIFNYFRDWSVVLSATVTLLLAMAAFGAIAENRRIRLEDIDLSSIKHSLEEILRWCEEAHASLTTTNIYEVQGEQRQMIMKLSMISARTPRIREYSEWLGDELPVLVGNAIKSLHLFTEVLKNDVDRILTDSDEDPSSSFIDSRDKLRESLEGVLSNASVRRAGADSSVALKDIYSGFK